MPIDIRDITDVSGCRRVVSLQIEVWGQDGEIVPASVLVASAKRGGLLIGAYDGDDLAGFVWSMPGWRDGMPTHWSHMLGVRPGARGAGIGERLKVAQRERALSAGIDLIEWTFDPLQAQNAYLNISVLGCIASTYRVDAYGEMSGPLHRGTPTDRLVAEWWIRAPHVIRRMANRTADSGTLTGIRGVDLRQAPKTIAVDEAGKWHRSGSPDTGLDAPRVLLPVPPRFSEMQQQATEIALAWRLAARTVFTAYFARDYRVVDFLRNPDDGGAYLLSRVPAERG
jgi:predicted GNAT superfamily acetyltransferase